LLPFQSGSAESPSLDNSSEPSPELPAPVKILDQKVTVSSNQVTAETASGDKFVVVYHKVPLRGKLTDVGKLAMYDWLVKEKGLETAEEWAGLFLAGDTKAADGDKYEPTGPGWKWIANQTASLAAATGEESKEKEEDKSPKFTSLSTIQLKGRLILESAAKYTLDDKDKEYVSFFHTFERSTAWARKCALN